MHKFDIQKHVRLRSMSVSTTRRNPAGSDSSRYVLFFAKLSSPMMSTQFVTENPEVLTYTRKGTQSLKKRRNVMPQSPCLD